jgi:hypothetical protein
MPGYKKFNNEFDHIRHKAYSKAKSQADYRGEPWLLTIQDWFDLWSDPEVWYRRGRKSDSVCMTRLNQTGPWDVVNTIIVTRKSQLADKNITRKYKNYDIS